MGSGRMLLFWEITGMYQKTACFGRISIFRFKILLEGQRTLYFRFKPSEALGMFHIKLSTGVENDML